MNNNHHLKSLSSAPQAKVTVHAVPLQGGHFEEPTAVRTDVPVILNTCQSRYFFSSGGYLNRWQKSSVLLNDYLVVRVARRTLAGAYGS